LRVDVDRVPHSKRAGGQYVDTQAGSMSQFPNNVGLRQAGGSQMLGERPARFAKLNAPELDRADRKDLPDERIQANAASDDIASRIREPDRGAISR